MSAQREVERDFFRARDHAERADAYAALDPDANKERLFLPLMAALGVVGIGFGLWLNAQGPQDSPARAEKAAPVVAADAAETAVEEAVAPAPAAVAAAAEPKPTPKNKMMRRRQSAPAPVAAVSPVPPTPSVPQGVPVQPPEAEVGAPPQDVADVPTHATGAQALPDSPSADAPAPVEPEAPVEAPAEAAAPAGALAQAKAHLEANHFAKALSALEGDTSAEAAALRGRALFETGKDAAAKKALEQAHAGGVRTPETLLLLGELRQTRKDLAGAREAYQAFLSSHPDSAYASEVRSILARL